jgi:hypothetical protein
MRERAARAPLHRWPHATRHTRHTATGCHCNSRQQLPSAVGAVVLVLLAARQLAVAHFFVIGRLDGHGTTNGTCACSLIGPS